MSDVHWHLLTGEDGGEGCLDSEPVFGDAAKEVEPMAGRGSSVYGPPFTSLRWLPQAAGASGWSRFALTYHGVYRGLHQVVQTRPLPASTGWLCRWREASYLCGGAACPHQRGSL
eukprot:5744191-Amphidinium_carterae.1